MRTLHNSGAAAPGPVTPGSDEAPAGGTAQGFQVGTTDKADSATAARDAVSDWHRVGAGLSVQFTLRSGAIHCEWQPRMPTRREMKRVIDRYRVARHVFLTEMAARCGGAVVCLELPL